MIHQSSLAKMNISVAFVAIDSILVTFGSIKMLIVSSTDDISLSTGPSGSFRVTFPDVEMNRVLSTLALILGNLISSGMPFPQVLELLHIALPVVTQLDVSFNDSQIGVHFYSLDSLELFFASSFSLVISFTDGEYTMIQDGYFASPRMKAISPPYGTNEISPSAPCPCFTGDSGTFSSLVKEAVPGKLRCLSGAIIISNSALSVVMPIIFSFVKCISYLGAILVLVGSQSGSKRFKIDWNTLELLLETESCNLKISAKVAGEWDISMHCPEAKISKHPKALDNVLTKYLNIQPPLHFFQSLAMIVRLAYINKDILSNIQHSAMVTRAPISDKAPKVEWLLNNADLPFDVDLASSRIQIMV